MPNFYEKVKFFADFLITHKLKKGIHPRPCGMINLSNIISYGRGTLPYLIDMELGCSPSAAICAIPVFTTHPNVSGLFRNKKARRRMRAFLYSQPYDMRLEAIPSKKKRTTCLSWFSFCQETLYILK